MADTEIMRMVTIYHIKDFYYKNIFCKEKIIFRYFYGNELVCFIVKKGK